LISGEAKSYRLGARRSIPKETTLGIEAIRGYKMGRQQRSAREIAPRATARPCSDVTKKHLLRGTPSKHRRNLAFQ
jgi:hypothetical protein